MRRRSRAAARERPLRRRRSCSRRCSRRRRMARRRAAGCRRTRCRPAIRRRRSGALLRLVCGQGLETRKKRRCMPLSRPVADVARRYAPPVAMPPGMYPPPWPGAPLPHAAHYAPPPMHPPPGWPPHAPPPPGWPPPPHPPGAMMGMPPPQGLPPGLPPPMPPPLPPPQPPQQQQQRQSSPQQPAGAQWPQPLFPQRAAAQEAQDMALADADAEASEAAQALVWCDDAMSMVRAVVRRCRGAWHRCDAPHALHRAPHAC